MLYKGLHNVGPASGPSFIPVLPNFPSPLLQFVCVSSPNSIKLGQVSCDIAYMWNLKKMIKMNLFGGQRQTHGLGE